MEKRTYRASLFKTVIMLAWPTMLEQLLETCVSYIDAAMVGSIGARATAAVGCTQTVNWLIGSTVFASGIGFLSYISHELGAGRSENARRAAAQVTFLVLLIGSAVTILTFALHRAVPVIMNADPDIAVDAGTYFMIIYLPMIPRAATTLYGTCLRAAGDTRTPLKVTSMVNIVNIILNFLLIYPTRSAVILGRSFTLYGAGLGVIGAGIATAISFLCGGIGMTLAVFRHPLLSPRGISMKPDVSILKPVFRISVPCILQRIFTSAGYVVFASMVNGIGTVATAAHSIANTAESAFYIPGYGMQTAASTLAGNCWGERNEQRLHSTCQMLIVLEIALMTVTGSLLFICAPSLSKLFTADTAVISLTSTVLRMVAVSEPVFGMSVILNGIFQGVGDTRAIFIFDIACMWGVRILGTFIFVRHFGYGLPAAWACMIAHNVVLGTLLTIRYLSGKWNPLLTGREMH